MLLLFLSSTISICSMVCLQMSIPNVVSSVRIMSNTVASCFFIHNYILLLLAFIFASHITSVALVDAFHGTSLLRFNVYL